MEKKEYGYGCTKQESGVLFCAAIYNTGITLFFVHFCMTLNCLKAFCADDVFHTACVFSSSLRINAQMDQPGA